MGPGAVCCKVRRGGPDCRLLKAGAWCLTCECFVHLVVVRAWGLCTSKLGVGYGMGVCVCERDLREKKELGPELS